MSLYLRVIISDDGQYSNISKESLSSRTQEVLYISKLGRTPFLCPEAETVNTCAQYEVRIPFTNNAHV